MKRDDLLARLGFAGAGTAPAPFDVGSGPARRVERGAEDRVLRFRAAASAAGIEVAAPIDRAALGAALDHALQDVRRVAVAIEDAALDRLVRARIGMAGAAVAPDADVAFEVGLGITDARGGVAETGSVLLTARAGRAAALLPPRHLVLLPVSAIVSDLLDAGDLLRAACAASAGALLLTGPSKTADIEGVLVTGVHGPGSVRVLLLDA